jgi:hypothetical protein
VQDGANAFSNDWMLVDDEKPDHVTDVQPHVTGGPLSSPDAQRDPLSLA